MTIRAGRWHAPLPVWALCALCILACVRCEDAPAPLEPSTARPDGQKDEIAVKETRGLFSPRMDYEQWTPLGHGDPLKNDPTYDYVPPVLERVHYWIDPTSRKPDPAVSGDLNKKTEILVLGVSSKKPSTGFSAADSRTGSFDSIMKFVTGPSFGSYPRMPRPQYSVSQPYFPGYYKKDEQRVPYTMLMPPPAPAPASASAAVPFQQPIVSSTSTTTPVPNTSTVSIEESNLVFHSSSLSTPDEWKGSNTYATLAEPSSQVTWRTPLELPQNGTLVPVVHSPATYAVVPSLQPPDAVMHKGHVTDDALDPYVSIGKPDAQVQPATGMGADSISVAKAPSLPPKSTFIVTSMGAMYHKPPPPMKLEAPMTLQTMQTMQPPPTTRPLIHSLLVREMTSAGDMTSTPAPAPTTSVSSLTTDPLFKHYKQPVEPVRGPLYLIIQGHSKVKTYGPSRLPNGASAHETNEIQTEDRPTEAEYQVKHLHELLRDVKERERERDRDRRDGRAARLRTLSQVVAEGFGAVAEVERAARRADDVRETELVVQYDVAASAEASSEVYHKGIVEPELPPSRKGSDN